MAENVDSWSAQGLKNIFGDSVKVIEMQSEAGAAGAVHGSLAAGALTTTYTASQGLLLMVPNMYKIAGELLPCVIHVSARAVATHALNIFGDHSDVYATRQTGFAMLAESNPQEIMDLGAVAHLATIKGRVPFVSFFDGFRTSHEIQKIEVWDFDDLKGMVDQDALKAFRDRALNPDHPVLRGSAENGDIFFQHRESCNPYYDALPEIVEEYMNKVNEKIGTDYKLFNYYGAPDAERVIVAMGSICDTAEEVIDYMTAQGEKVGLIKVRLYRPFRADKLVEAIPATCKSIAVLDRTKEPGSLGEPLYLDVVTALEQTGRTGIKVVGGRYGLGSKDTPPSSIFAVYENLAAAQPKHNFTIGIVDDVTNLSLPETNLVDTTPKGTISCKFWGLGGDGTVGANKNSIKIIGDHTDKYIQAYFQYDSKKTGGVTISHLRFGDTPIRSTYYVTKADFVACHNPSYIKKGYKIVEDVKPGGTFLLNCQWTPEELETHLPNSVKRYIAKNGLKFYIVNAIDLAQKTGMGKHTNTILQAAFFALANIIPMDQAIDYMKKAAYKSYSKKGEDVVKKNYDAIDAGATAYAKVDVPASWADLPDDAPAAPATGKREDLVNFVNSVVIPVSQMRGDSLPVSAFKGREDGTYPQGTSAYEKRGVAVEVPTWIPENCIQCNQCAYVCPHATIRAFALDADEAANAPAGMKMKKMIGKGCENYQFAIAISPLDCMGCTLCVKTCPSKTKALEMRPQEEELPGQAVFNYCVEKVTKKETPFAPTTLKGSQFNQPLLEFSGSCAGCAETTYARIITQLFGERMYISNATGCSSIWGGSAPATPYTVNRDSGHGPAWANSLFEDNAEHGLGMRLAVKVRRERLARTVKKLIEIEYCDEDIKAAGAEWLDKMEDAKLSGEAGRKLLAACDFVRTERDGCDCEACTLAREIIDSADMLEKKSVWIFGGDGWAYDIGFGGLDHVIASGEDVNIMVFDTEVYSNTGGQASKASQLGQVAQFAAAGKAIGKKNLAEIAMSYGYVYVAQIALGADMNQAIKAITEAEAYPGPSLIIGYAPCEMHNIRDGGMTMCQLEIKKAVESGYWHMFRYNPALKAEGKNPFTLDSKEPTADYIDFIKGEARYTALTLAFPERADKLFEEAKQAAAAKYQHLLKLKELYEAPQPEEK
jgi:pyruvate-ferredoxin/flavodoxin oxidoreductase